MGNSLIDRYKYDPVKCYRLAKGETQPVKINLFLATMFTPEQIDRILMKELVASTAVAPVDCSKFIGINREWFLDRADYLDRIEKEVMNR